MSIVLTPCTRDEANAFVLAHHRHHDPVVGHIFALAAAVDDTIIGVAIVGRPVARLLDSGWTAEVTRLCTDGTRNACSFLYGAAWRAARALGYRKLITYTLAEEGGASLRAAGWVCLGEAGGGSWSRRDRPRVDTHPTQTKMRWEAAHGSVRAELAKSAGGGESPGCTCATCEYIRAQSKPPILAWPQPSTPSIVGYRCANCGQWATGLHSCTVCADSRAAEGDGGK